MTEGVKARVLFAILECAPMGRSREQFQAYARTGDVEGLWSYYQNAMARRADVLGYSHPKPEEKTPKMVRRASLGVAHPTAFA